MVIAFVLAVPLAYFVMKAWLDGFAYKVGVSIAALFAGGLVVILVGLLSVSYQAIRAALLNPVESLKEE
jgi:putative ABC transport system permease protein